MARYHPLISHLHHYHSIDWSIFLYCSLIFGIAVRITLLLIGLLYMITVCDIINMLNSRRVVSNSNFAEFRMRIPNSSFAVMIFENNPREFPRVTVNIRVHNSQIFFFLAAIKSSNKPTTLQTPLQLWGEATNWNKLTPRRKFQQPEKYWQSSSKLTKLSWRIFS